MCSDKARDEASLPPWVMPVAVGVVGLALTYGVAKTVTDLRNARQQSDQPLKPWERMP